MPTRLAAVALLTAGFLAAAACAQEPVPPVATTAQPRLVLKPYQVADLVIPACCKATKTDESRLIKLIQDAVAPTSWAATGGRGTIDYFPMTMTLVINQTPDVQEQIADLLAALRREQDTQVALEVRVVSLPEGFCERVGVDCNVSPEKAAFLNGKQLTQLLEAVQGDQRANIMRAPKVTMLNGQTGVVDCTQKQPFVTGFELVRHEDADVPAVTPRKEELVTGFRMSARPVVSADHRYVQVELKLDQTDLASSVVAATPVTVQLKDGQGQTRTLALLLQQPKVNAIRIEKKLTIPDGGTVLLGGMKKVIEGRTEATTPVLSKVPYVNRLFTNVGYAREAQDVYVLVTPRVIVNEEEERRQTGVYRSDAPACAEESGACASACRQGKALAELLKAYDEACAAGRKDEAAKLAQAALILDPTCFAKGHGR